MPQIIPIKDLKNTSEISDMCHRAEEPIYITKNGYGDIRLKGRGHAIRCVLFAFVGYSGRSVEGTIAGLLIKLRK